MSTPWLKFYPSDWRADPALRMCSLTARGLWMEMLCVMHEAVPRGHMLVNGRPLSERQLAGLTGCAVDELRVLLQELNDAGVYGEQDGVIFSRRMCRDEEKAARDKANGSKGGNPSLTQDNGGVNPTSNPKVPTEDKAQIPEARDQKKEEEKKERVALTAAQPAPPSPKNSRGSSIPENWEPNDKHFEFALSNSLSPDWIRARAVDMREWAMANRNRSVARKADWDLTFSGWIRRDFEKNPPRQFNQPAFTSNRQEPRNGNRIINAIDRIGAQLEDFESGGVSVSGRGFAN